MDKLPKDIKKIICRSCQALPEIVHEELLNATREIRKDPNNYENLCLHKCKGIDVRYWDLTWVTFSSHIHFSLCHFCSNSLVFNPNSYK